MCCRLILSVSMVVLLCSAQPTSPPTISETFSAEFKARVIKKNVVTAEGHAVFAQNQITRNQMANDTMFEPGKPEKKMHSFDLDRHDLNQSFTIAGTSAFNTLRCHNVSYNEYTNFWWWVEHAQLSGEHNGMMVWKYESKKDGVTYELEVKKDAPSIPVIVHVRQVQQEEVGEFTVVQFIPDKVGEEFFELPKQCNRH